MGPMPSTRLPTRMTSSPAGTGGAVSMSVSSWISSPAAFSPLQFSHTITLWLSCTYANACAKSCSARLRPSSGPAEEGSLRSSLVIASGVALDPTCLYPDATIVFFSAIAAVAEAVKGEGRNNAREKCQGTEGRLRRLSAANLCKVFPKTMEAQSPAPAQPDAPSAAPAALPAAPPSRPSASLLTSMSLAASPQMMRAMLWASRARRQRTRRPIRAASICCTRRCPARVGAWGRSRTMCACSAEASPRHCSARRA